MTAGVGLAMCSDLPSAPRTRARAVGRLAFAPVFSRAAEQTYDRLPDFGIDFDNVRVVIARSSTDTVKDTTVSFRRGQADLSLDLGVQVRSEHETFDAGIDYRNQSEVLFHGQGKVQAHAANEAAPPPPQIDVEYQGPGANAKRLQVAPRTSAISVADSVRFSATAFDDKDQPITNVPIAWTSSDTTLATIGLSGVLHPTGKRGTVTITATTPTDLTDHASASLIPLPKALAVISGGGESGVAGQVLAKQVVVEVRASDSLPVPGVPLSFTAPAGASVTPASAVADSNGRVSATLTLGPAAGAQVFSANAGTLSVQIPETATPGALAKIVFKTQPSNVSAGVAIAPAVQVQLLDANGNQTTDNTNVGLTLHGGVPGAVLSGTVSQAATSGVATFNDLSVDKQGTGYTLQASAGSNAASATSGAFDVSTGHAAKLARVGDSVVVFGAGALPASAPAVVVSDASGNPVPGMPVTVTVTRATSPSATSTSTTNTGADGRVALFADAPKVADTYTVKAASDGLSGSPVTVTAKVSAADAAKVAFVTQPSDTSTTSVISPAVVVQVRDAYGNVVPSDTTKIALQIAATAATSGATLGGTSRQTSKGGIATFPDLTIAQAGSGYRLVATSGKLTADTSTTFNIHAVLPRLTIVTAPDTLPRNSATLSTQPVLSLVDGGGQPLSGVVVSASAIGTQPSLARVGPGPVFDGAPAIDPLPTLSNNTATTDAKGLATFNGLKARGKIQTFGVQFSATINGVTVSVTSPGMLHLRAGNPFRFDDSADTIVVDTIGARFGASHRHAPRRVLLDDSDNPVFGEKVTFTAASGSCALHGNAASVDVVTDSSGVAALDSLALPASAAGSCHLEAKDVNFPGAGSARFVAIGKPKKTTHVWVGRADTVWSNPANWYDSVAANDQAHNVFIPSGVGRQPKLTSAATTGDLVLESGANVDIRGTSGGLAAFGDVDANGGSISNGTLALRGSGKTVRGTLPSVLVGQSGCSASTAAYTLSDSTTIAGDLVTNCPLDAGAHRLEVSGSVDASAGAITNGTLALHGSSATVRGTVPTLVIGRSNCTDGAAATLAGDVSVAGDLTTNCLLDVHGKSLQVNGKFATSGSGGTLRMTDSTAKVTVNGDVAFGGASTSGKLTAGELLVKGNFTQSGDAASFAASGTQKVTFAGAGSQTVSFGSAGSSSSRFARVEVDDSTTFATSAVADSVTVSASTLALSADATVNGNLVVKGGRVRSSTANLNVGGQVTADTTSDLGGLAQLTETGTSFPSLANTIAGKAPMNTVLTGSVTLSDNVVFGGALTVKGSLDVHGKTLQVNGDLSTANSGTMTMVDAASTVTVGGNATFGGASTAGKLSAGVLTVSGNFTQTGDASSFAASGSHKVTLASSGAQTVSFANPDPSASHFARLEIRSSTAASPSISRLGPLFNRTPGRVLFGTSSATSGAAFNTNIFADSITVDSTTAEFQGDATVSGNLVAHKGSLASGASTNVTVAGRVIGDVDSDLGGLTLLTVSGNAFPSLANATDGKAPAKTALTGNVTLHGSVTLGGTLDIQGNLNVNGDTLTITRDLSVSGSTGVLTMPAGDSNYVKVTGNVRFDGAQSDAALQHGVLDVAGTFTQAATNSSKSFRPDTSLILRLTASNRTSPQTVSFADTLDSYLGRLQVYTTASDTLGGAKIASNVAAHGDVDVYGYLDVPASSTFSVASGKKLKLHASSHLWADGNVKYNSLNCKKDRTAATVLGTNAHVVTHDGGTKCTDDNVP